MRKAHGLFVFGASVILAAFAQQAAKNDFDGKTWWDYVKVLADDNMEGRETGSAGLKRAEAYVVEQLKVGRRRTCRQRWLLPAREIRGAPDCREGFEHRAHSRRKKRASHAGRRRVLQHARQPRARNRSAAGVCRLWAHDSREKLRRSRRFGSERQSRGDIRRLARGNAHERSRRTINPPASAGNRCEKQA